MKWSAFSNIKAAPNVTNTSSDGKDMEQMKTRGSLRKTSGIPRRYSQSIKEEQNCSNKTPTTTIPTHRTCPPITPDEPHLTLMSTTPIASPTLLSEKRKTHNPYLCYPLDHLPPDQSP